MDFKDDDSNASTENSMVADEPLKQELQEKEISTLKPKVLKMYGDTLPSGITVEVANYVKERGSFYDQQVNISDDATEVTVSNGCNYYVRKFDLKPILDEKTVMIAKDIISDHSPVKRFKALDEILHLMKDEPMLELSSFYCGGSFTIDSVASCSEVMDATILTREAMKKADDFGASTIDGSNYVEKFNDDSEEDTVSMDFEEDNSSQISFELRRSSKPEGCDNVSEILEKLEQGPEFWTVFHDQQKEDQTIKIDIIQLMEQQANLHDDKTLRKAVEFIKGYCRSHGHFHFLGPKHTLNKVSFISLLFI